jgi:hypothetical protein
MNNYYILGNEEHNDRKVKCVLVEDTLKKEVKIDKYIQIMISL